jgi:hypothetical protein
VVAGGLGGGLSGGGGGGDPLGSRGGASASLSLPLSLPYPPSSPTPEAGAAVPEADIDPDPADRDPGPGPGPVPPVTAIGALDVLAAPATPPTSSSARARTRAHTAEEGAPARMNANRASPPCRVKMRDSRAAALGERASARAVCSINLRISGVGCCQRVGKQGR